MKTPSHSERRARGLLALGLVATLVLPIAGAANSHPIHKFWRYGKDVRHHKWHHHDTAKRKHQRWHRNHPDATRKQHRRFHHQRLIHVNRDKHQFRIEESQAGVASYFSGRVGACGRPLIGLYAAHKSWPCGSKVSVKRGGRYVIVRVLDRGPYTRGRVIDLSPNAFKRLGSLSSGTMDVKIFRLKRK
ncbi:MAG TPA: septal ring lytic transglycosylase RlpA family protein [Actinomycetota bacterium]|nr:septal ring lytic transglycosylase RlpA family protein [Actinomycetota bacterium]